MTTSDSRAASSWQYGLALTSLATAAIHFAVTGDHFEEDVLFGVFFVAVAWAQALWAVAILLTPTRLVLAAGLAGNLAVVVLWVVSRTVGVPIGPEAGTAEAVGAIDVAATILELVIVVVSALVLADRSVSESRAAQLGLVPLGLAIVGISSAVIFAGADHTHDEHAAEHAHGDHAHGDHATETGDHALGAHAGHHMVGGSGEPDPVQLEFIRKAMQKYQSVDVAYAAGWQQEHPDWPRIGAHFYRGGDWAGSFPARPGLDIGDPEFLMYSKLLTGKWRLVAVAYVLDQARYPQPPTNLTGAVYHQHTWTCMVDGEELEQEDYGVVSRQECSEMGGRWSPGGVWMTHVWLIDNPKGVFAEANPALVAG